MNRKNIKKSTNLLNERVSKSFKLFNTLNPQNLSYIISAEPYDCRILDGTPDGRVIVPFSPVFEPARTSNVKILSREIKISETKVVCIKKGKGNRKVYRNSVWWNAHLMIKFIFPIRAYDENGEPYKVKCNKSHYPLPDEECETKDNILVSTTYKTIVNFSLPEYCCNSDEEERLNCQGYNSKLFHTQVDVLPEIIRSRADKEYYWEPSFVKFYDVNCEDYTKIFIYMIIRLKVKVECFLEEDK